MKLIINSNDSPQEVFKAQVNAEAIEKWAREYKTIEIPKVPQVKVRKNVVWWTVFFKEILLEFRP